MYLMRSLRLLAVLLLVCCGLVQAESAAPPDIDRNNPEIVLATKGEAILTQQEIDAAFSRIPEEHRLAFIRDGAKVDRMVQSLLQVKLLLIEANKAGFADDPVMQLRMQQAANKELGDAWTQHVLQNAPEADLAAMAHEDYLADPDAYRTSVTIDVSHVLIGNEKRSDEEALALAEELRARIDADPAIFDSLVPEFSDDPAKLTNFGHYPGMSRGQMVKPFEEAAFALKQPGDIAGPVKTEYGYHLIRLDVRHESDLPPFEQVKSDAETRVKARHGEAHLTRYLQKLFSEPTSIPDGAVDVMLRRYFGENLEKAPVFTEDGPG